MMVLRDTLVEGREEPYDEVEDLSNSLRDALQDEAVKPKLHCLMMDPAFSMVTVQNEDSAIVWETASSRCSTPWASEMNATAPDPSCALTSPGTAGNIVVVMDEELMTRREKRKPRPVKTKALPYTGGDDDDEIMRPAMVEVSLPNVPQAEDEMANAKEEKHQRLFSLLSEGSEILNIIAPPKVSTVDEEASKRLEDCLFYLEETPAVKSTQMFPDEPEDVTAEAETGEPNVVTSIISEPYVPVTPFVGSKRGATADDYFEKFTLLDNQGPSGEAQTAHQKTEGSTEDIQDKDEAPPAPSPGLSCVSSAVSMLDISGEHLDDVFYGCSSRSEPHSPDDIACARQETRDLSKSSLKKSGSALFESEESVLTPIYLPEGPPKIIDLNLLEEPKAMAFLYSDLYADAVGSRKKQDDDAESVTSEKSFNRQESDSEDQGYLEKFVLKMETPKCDLEPDLCCKESQDSFRLAGYMEEPKTQVEMKPEEMEEITDFFRNSASSSPCEPVDLYQPEPEEEPKVTRTTRVSFKDEVAKNEKGGSNSPPFMDDIDFEEAFLPVEISEDCPAWEENLQTFSTKKSTSTRTDKPKSTSKTLQEPPKSTHIINTVKPKVPCYKPFLDLSPLLPAESEDEEQQTDEEKKQEDKSINGSEETRTSEAKVEEETSETPHDVTQHGCDDVTAADVQDHLFENNAEDHNETVDAPAALNKSK